MAGWHGLVGTALAPGALTEVVWLLDKGESRGDSPVQKKRCLCDEDGGLPGDLSLGEELRTSRSSWMTERGMLRPTLHVQSISRAVSAQREHNQNSSGRLTPGHEEQ